MIRRLLALTAAAGLLACADAPVAPTGGPSFDFSNGPAQSGRVYRFGDSVAVFISDPASGLQAWHGFDVVAYCHGLGRNYDLVNSEVHQSPQDGFRELRNIHGDVQTSVWTLGPNSCAHYTSVSPLATGVSNFRGTDNDVAAFARINPKNENAFGWMANGTLTDWSGNRVKYSATHRGHWDGIDLASFKSESHINLQHY